MHWRNNAIAAPRGLFPMILLIQASASWVLLPTRADARNRQFSGFVVILKDELGRKHLLRHS